MKTDVLICPIKMARIVKRWTTIEGS
uniref:Uncharacterized protein n=1 Tax=Arundo donax TaxID=35708 RepID=A0A0A9PR58_ARUDO